MEASGEREAACLTVASVIPRGLQILFKDLFRFLLVYLLFMIGYASGELGAPGGCGGARGGGG